MTVSIFYLRNGVLMRRDQTDTHFRAGVASDLEIAAFLYGKLLTEGNSERKN